MLGLGRRRLDNPTWLLEFLPEGREFSEQKGCQGKVSPATSATVKSSSPCDLFTLPGQPPPYSTRGSLPIVLPRGAMHVLCTFLKEHMRADLPEEPAKPGSQLSRVISHL